MILTLTALRIPYYFPQSTGQQSPRKNRVRFRVHVVSKRPETDTNGVIADMKHCGTWNNRNKTLSDIASAPFHVESRGVCWLGVMALGILSQKTLGLHWSKRKRICYNICSILTAVRMNDVRFSFFQVLYP